jgi:hypothetical protein
MTVKKSKILSYQVFMLFKDTKKKPQTYCIEMKEDMRIILEKMKKLSFHHLIEGSLSQVSSDSTVPNKIISIPWEGVKWSGDELEEIIPIIQEEFDSSTIINIFEQDSYFPKQTYAKKSQFRAP